MDKSSESGDGPGAMDIPVGDSRAFARLAALAIGPMVLLASAAALICLRLHAFSLPLETDECNYVYIGGRLLAGDRIYVDVWDHQPPGVFLFFAGVQALFGDSPVVFRLTALVFSLASLGLIYSILRRSAGGFAGALGAVLFALVSADPGTAGEGCNREIYMNTLVLLAWWILGRGVIRVDRRWRKGVVHGAAQNVTAQSEDQAAAVPPLPMAFDRRRVFLIGLVLALASALKTVIAVHWLVLFVAIVSLAQPRQCALIERIRIGGKVLFWSGLGPGLLWFAIATYFGASGRWGEFVDAVFAANLSYSERPEPFFVRFVQFFQPQRHPFLFDSAKTLWLALGASVVWLVWRAIVEVDHWRHTYPLLLVLSGYLAVCLPAQFWPHYYYMLIPGAVIAVSQAAAGIGQAAFRRSRGLGLEGDRVWSRTSHVVTVALIVSVGYTQWEHYLSRSPMEVTLQRYNGRDFWGRGQGENVRRATDSDDTVFVYGNDASIYYYAQRRCASRYTMITALREGYRGVERRWASLLSDLTQHKPAIILLLFDQPPFPGWEPFLKEHYQPQPIGADFHDKHPGEVIMLVLGRNDRAFPEMEWNWDRAMVEGDAAK